MDKQHKVRTDSFIDNDLKSLSTRDRWAIEDLRTFRNCHSLEWIERIPEFVIIVRYLRGSIKADTDLRLCCTIRRLQLLNFTLGTTIHHVEENTGKVNETFYGCPFKSCTECLTNAIPFEEEVAAMQWLYITEEELALYFIEHIFNDRSFIGPSKMTRILQGLSLVTEGRYNNYTGTIAHFVENIRTTNTVYNESTLPMTYTSDMLKIAIKQGYVTDLWHQNSGKEVRIATPFPAIPVKYTCPSEWCPFKQESSTTTTDCGTQTTMFRKRPHLKSLPFASLNDPPNSEEQDEGCALKKQLYSNNYSLLNDDLLFTVITQCNQEGSYEREEGGKCIIYRFKQAMDAYEKRFGTKYFHVLM